jgi:hypothetical protein
MSKGTMLFAVIAVALAGCMSDDESLRFSAEKHVAAMLKDPDSARFSGVYLVPGPMREGVQTVAICGVVNGKNSFGAYGGGERFVAYGYKGKVGDSRLLGISRAYFEGADRRTTVDTTDKPNKTTIFEKIHWNEACVDAAHPPTYSGEDSSV